MIDAIVRSQVRISPTSVPEGEIAIPYLAFVDVDFASQTRESSYAGACEIVDPIYTSSSIQTRFWFTFVDVDLAINSYFQ